MDALLLSFPGPLQTVAGYLTDRTPLSSGSREIVWSGAEQAAVAGHQAWLWWGLLISLLVTLAVIGACIMALRVKGMGPTPEQALIEEVLREAREEERSGRNRTTGAPWERPADWWKDAG